jgi:hypothetical protein
MSECNIALSANINLKEQPNSLYAHGSVMVYSDASQVSIERTEPQGINPTILLLTLRISEGSGPMKGTPRSFSYSERGAHVSAFKEVTVQLPGGDSCTTTIQTFG